MAAGALENQNIELNSSWMDISAGLIAKGTAGALAASAAVGGGIMANRQGLLGDWFGANVESVVDVEGSGNGSPQGTEETGIISNSEDSRVEAPSTGGQNVPTTAPTHQPDGKVQGALDAAQSQSHVLREDTNSPAGEKTVVDSTKNLKETTQDAKGDVSEEQKTSPTKWDSALINYLKNKNNSNNRDIIFTVKTGKDGTGALSDDFPNFEDGEGKDNKNKQQSTITVSAATSDANLSGTDSAAEIEKLKKMNGGENDGQIWTWECKIIFTRNKSGNDGFSFENKDKLFGNEGFFNKLISAGEKELKIKFIEKCAGSRNNDEFNKYENKTTLDDAKVTSEKIFKLEKEGDTKWNAKGGFDKWFIKPSQSKPTRSST